MINFYKVILVLIFVFFCENEKGRRVDPRKVDFPHNRFARNFDFRISRKYFSREITFREKFSNSEFRKIIFIPREVRAPEKYSDDSFFANFSSSIPISTKLSSKDPGFFDAWSSAPGFMFYQGFFSAFCTWFLLKMWFYSHLVTDTFYTSWLGAQKVIIFTLVCHHTVSLG